MMPRGILLLLTCAVGLVTCLPTTTLPPEFYWWQKVTTPPSTTLPPRDPPKPVYQERLLEVKTDDLPDMLIHDHVKPNMNDIDVNGHVEALLYELNDKQMQLSLMESQEGDGFYVKLAFSKGLLDRVLRHLQEMSDKLSSWEQETAKPHSRKRRSAYFLATVVSDPNSTSAKITVHLLSYKQQDACAENCMYSVEWRAVNNPSAARGSMTVAWGKEGGIHTISNLQFNTLYEVKTCILNQTGMYRSEEQRCNIKAVRTDKSFKDKPINDLLDNPGQQYYPFDNPYGNSTNQQAISNQNSQSANNNPNTNNQNPNSNQNTNSNQNSNTQYSNPAPYNYCPASERCACTCN